jgi:peptidyl-prolyl cis-trans isomerase C
MPEERIARINGVALHAAGEDLPAEELRQRACTELLRQAAQGQGLLAGSDAPTADGVISEAAAGAIEALLERVLQIPEPSEDACRRHYAANASSYRTGERARVRHILFAVTPGVDVAALRKLAEPVFLDVRCQEAGARDAFADAARRWSNCPSGAQGGELGWLTAADCAPEFAREIFGRAEIGVLARLVHSRFGLHVVEVCEREAARPAAFEDVRTSVALVLRQQAWVNALRQYLQVLAGAASLEGVDIEGAETPLVQ